MKHRGVEPEGIAIAEELGIAYDGIWEGLGYTFTDVMETGSTFVVKTPEQARIKLKEMRETFARAEKPPSTHPLIIEQYPHGEVPEKIEVSGLKVKVPPLRGEDIGEDAAIRTDQRLDKTVEHLGYHSISLSNEELADIGRTIPTDVDIINEAQRRLRAMVVLPDNELSPRQLTHLNLARVIAESSDKSMLGVYAATIPPASDRVKTAGVYSTQSKSIYLSPEILNQGRSTVDTLVHELGHHRQSIKEDLTPEHASAMTSIADNLIIAVNGGSYDSLIKDVEW